MKATRLKFKHDSKLEFMLRLYKANIFCCHRADAEAEGVHCVCAFADPKNRNVFLIDEDCNQLSTESIRVIIFHELAHVINPEITEEEADYFAECNTSREALRKARLETEGVRLSIRAHRAGLREMEHEFVDKLDRLHSLIGQI